jgi:hypothetical protein
VADLFPGNYLEFKVRNCSSLYASFYNTERVEVKQGIALQNHDILDVTPLTFRPLSRRVQSAAAVSIVTQVDNGTFRYFPESSKGLVAIAGAALAPSRDHVIRISAPGIDSAGHGAMQFEGIWLNEGGNLSPWKKTIRTTPPELIHTLQPAGAQNLHHHRNRQSTTDSSERISGVVHNVNGAENPRFLRRKTLEIVAGLSGSESEPAIDRNLATLKGWDSLIGGRYDIDHVNIAVPGMCLTGACVEWQAHSASVKDTYFRR